MTYPKTAATVADWDAAWTAMCEKAFDGLTVDPARLARIRAMLPAALRGLREEGHLSTYLDVDEAKQGLTDAVTSYLT